MHHNTFIVTSKLCCNDMIICICVVSQVNPNLLPNILAQFIRTPRPEIKLVDTEFDGNVIVIYGVRRTSQKKGSAILRWDFQFNNEDYSTVETKKKVSRPKRRPLI
jgi:hypothetical protein